MYIRHNLILNMEETGRWDLINNGVNIEWDKGSNLMLGRKFTGFISYL